MNLKEELLKLKKQIIEESKKKAYANEKLESHSFTNRKVYRLHYINYHFLKNNDKVGIMNIKYKPFTISKSLTTEETLKVLSYLSDMIRNSANAKPFSLSLITTLDTLLDGSDLGFRRVPEANDDCVLHLFAVEGHKGLFKKSKFYQKYFAWYKKNVTKDEVKAIYNKIGLEFNDDIYRKKRKRISK